MGLPTVGEGEDRYNRSRLFGDRLEVLRKRPYFMFHGTRDDNVHYQQTMLLTGALAERNILFWQHSYPDQDHSIMSYQHHLYKSLIDFFLNDCFKQRKSK